MAKSPKYDLHAEVRVPLFGLPSKVVAVIENVAQARQAPVDYAVAPALAALSVAIGSGVKVEADYDNPLNLFVGSVGESSANKSAPCDDLLRPIDEIDKALYDLYQQEKTKREMEAAIEGKGKRGRPTQKADLPPVKQVIMSDATPEARFDALSHNPRGILWYRDELKAVFDDFGRYTQSGEASDLLTIFDGRGLKSNRKSDGMRSIDKPYLSLLGTIQPAALHAAFGKTVMLDSGLVPRFIWFEPMGRIDRDFSKSDRPDQELMAWWSDFIKTIYGMNLQATAIFSDDARLALDLFRNVTGNGVAGYEATMWGKLHKIAYKLSGIAAVAQAVADGRDLSEPIVVNADQMRWAVALCVYLHRTHLSVERYCRGGVGVRLAKEDIVQALARDWRNVPKKCIVAALLKHYPETKKTALANALGVSKPTISEIKSFADDNYN